MLFGYIFEVVKDHKLAEQYLVNIYADVPQHLDKINVTGANAWCQLRSLAKSKLADFTNPGKDTLHTETNLSTYNNRNKYLDLMADEQRMIFCDAYYHGKNIDGLSAKYGKPGNEIRKVLKEAFAILKNGK
jgi:hypothetical protein